MQKISTASSRRPTANVEDECKKIRMFHISFYEEEIVDIEDDAYTLAITFIRPCDAVSRNRLY